MFAMDNPSLPSGWNTLSRRLWLTDKRSLTGRCFDQFIFLQSTWPYVWLYPEFNSEVLGGWIVNKRKLQHELLRKENQPISLSLAGNSKNHQLSQLKNILLSKKYSQSRWIEDITLRTSFYSFGGRWVWGKKDSNCFRTVEKRTGLNAEDSRKPKFRKAEQSFFPKLDSGQHCVS